MIKISDKILEMSLFGSQAICNPPPRNSDEDWILYTNDLDGLKIDLERAYFQADITGKYDDSPFKSYRKGDLNYIVTDNLKFFEATKTATRMARELNIRRKKDRVVFYKIVRNAFGEDLNIYK